MDSLTIKALLEAGANFGSLLRNLVGLAKKGMSLETTQVLTETQTAFLDLQSKQQDLIDENRDLRERVRELQDSLQIRVSLECHHKAYWTRKSPQTLEGPFSMTSWDTEQKLVRLHSHDEPMEDRPDELYFYSNSNRDTTYVPLAFLREYGVARVGEVRPSHPIMKRAVRPRMAGE